MAKRRFDPVPIYVPEITLAGGFFSYPTLGAALFVDGVDGNDLRSGLKSTEPLKTIQKAIDKAKSGDVIMIAPKGGTSEDDVVGYDETVSILPTGGKDGKLSRLTLIGAGPRGSVFIEASAAGAEGMQVKANDVTLVNIGVAGNSTADYALNVNGTKPGSIKFGKRFRAFGCKFELGDGTGPAVLLDGSADYQVGDALFYDCEFAWAGTGVKFDDSAYGFPTQIFVKKSHFHNIATAGLGVAAGGLVKNLLLEGCTFDNKEDGTAPTDYILLSDNGNTGLIVGNYFATATNAASVLTIGTGLKWGPNGTEAGWSTARPV